MTVLDAEPPVSCRCGSSLIHTKDGAWHHVAPSKRCPVADPNPRHLARWKVWRDSRRAA